MTYTATLNLWKLRIAISSLRTSTAVAQIAWTTIKRMAVTPVTPWTPKVSPPAMSIIMAVPTVSQTSTARPESLTS